MELRNLNEVQAKIQSNRPPVLEHTLYAMYALCRDIQSHCADTISNGVVEDYKELNNRLALMANMLCKIHKKHSDGIRRVVADAFPAALYDIEKEVRQTEERLRGAETQLRAKEEQMRQQQQLLAQERAKQQQISQTEARIASLRSEMEKIQNVDLPSLMRLEATLNSQKNALEGQKNEQLKANARLQHDVDANRLGKEAAVREQNRLNGELARVKGELGMQKQENSNLEGQISTTNRAIEQENRIAQERGPKVEANNRELSRLRQANELMRMQLEQHDTHMKAQTDLYKALLPQATSKNEELTRLKGQVQGLQDTITENQIQIERKNTELAEKTVEVEGQNRTLQELEEQIRNKKEEAEAMPEKIRKAAANKCAAEQELSNAKGKEAELSRQAEAARIQGQALQDLIEEHQNVLSALSGTAGELERINGDLETDQKNLKLLQKTRDEANESLGALRENVKMAEAEKTAAEAEVSRLTEAFRAADGDRVIAQRKHEALKLSVEGSKTTLELLTQENQNLTQQQEETIRKIDEAENEKKRMSGEISVLQEGLVQQNTDNEHFRNNELKTAHDELDTARSVGMKLAAERDRLKGELAAQKEEQFRIGNEILGLQTASQKTIAALEQLQENLKTVKRQCAEKENELETQDRRMQGLTEHLEKLKKQVEERRASVDTPDNKKLEEQYLNDLAELEQKEAKLRQMASDLETQSKMLIELRRKYENKWMQQQDVENKLRDLEKDLKELGDPKLLKKIEQDKQRIRILEEVKKTIHDMAVNLKPCNPDLTSNALKVVLTDVEVTLDELSKCIERYSRELNEAIG